MHPACTVAVQTDRSRRSQPVLSARPCAHVYQLHLCLQTLSYPPLVQSCGLRVTRLRLAPQLVVVVVSAKLLGQRRIGNARG